MTKKVAALVILLVSLISVGTFFVVPNLKFDYDFENFFPEGDEELAYFDAFRDQFETDNDFILLGIAVKDGVFDQAFLKNIEQLTKDVEQAPHVQYVLSPTNINRKIIGPLGPIDVPYIHIDDTSRYRADAKFIYASTTVVGSIFSVDAKSISLFVRAKDFIKKNESDSLIDQVHILLDTYNFDEVHMAGKLNGQRYYINKMEEELIIFVLTSLVLLVVILFLTFRTFWGIWIPVLIVFLTASWVLAIMYLTGKNMDLMSSMMPTILFVVGISDVVHIISKYLECLRSGMCKEEAIRVALRDVGLATLLTSITTALGFITLMSANINPVKEFGLYTAIGVGVAYILAVTLLPSILTIMGTPVVSRNAKANLVWANALRSVLIMIFNHKRKILFGTVGLLVACMFLISKMEVNNYLLEDLSANDPLKKDFQFFEKHYSGVRPYELGITVRDTNKTCLDYDVLQEMLHIEAYIKDTIGVGFIMSPIGVIKSIHQAQNGGGNKMYKFPDSQQNLVAVTKLISKYDKSKQMRTVLSEDARTSRISGKVTDHGGKAMSKYNSRLLQMATKFKHVDVHVTGTALLIDKNNEYLVENMLTGLLIAFCAVGLIVGLIYKSIKMVLISLVPNMLPLLMVAALMSLLNIDLKISTSIIFTIAFGIAVDDTIHFLSRFRLELGKGRSKLYAIKYTFLSTGKAIIITSVILFSGFIALTMSTFMSTFYIGFLISLTLLFAVISDLALLPVLLIYFFPDDTKTV